MVSRRTSGIAMIVIAVLVAVLLVIVLTPKNKTNSSKASTSANSSSSKSSASRVILDNLVTITFPCKTHVVKLNPTGADKTSGYGADCGVKVNNGSQELAFTAAVEEYPSNSAEEKAVFNYCSAKTTYPGPVSGSTIYILEPSSQVIDNVNFSTCALSIDAKNAYETTARAIDGNYGILINADVSSTTDRGALFSYLQNFLSTMTINSKAQSLNYNLGK